MISADSRFIEPDGKGITMSWFENCRSDDDGDDGDDDGDDGDHNGDDD